MKLHAISTCQLQYPLFVSQTHQLEECPVNCLNIFSTLQDGMVLVESSFQELMTNANSTGADLKKFEQMFSGSVLKIPKTL